MTDLNAQWSLDRVADELAEDGYALFSSKVREAAAEIERLRQEREWRPIESAPRDVHTHLLLAGPHWMTTGFWAPYMGGRWMPDEADKPLQNVTHWMPLPSAPDKAPRT